MNVVKICEKMIELTEEIRLIDPEIKNVLKYPALHEIKFEGANFISETFGIVRSQHSQEADDILSMQIDLAFLENHSKLAYLKACIKFELLRNNLIFEKAELFTTESGREYEQIDLSRSEKTMNGFSNLVVNYISLFAFVNYRLLDNAECFDVKCIRVEKNRDKKNHQRRERNIIRSYKCYTLKSDYPNSSITRRNMVCPAWEVRGHYRHYKSGKTIYISPFMKGKKRCSESPRDKEYRVINVNANGERRESGDQRRKKGNFVGVSGDRTQDQPVAGRKAGMDGEGDCG